MSDVLGRNNAVPALPEARYERPRWDEMVTENSMVTLINFEVVDDGNLCGVKSVAARGIDDVILVAAGYRKFTVGGKL